MSSPPPLPDDPLAKPPEAPWREFARAPLVPVALAATVGLLADRYIGVLLGAGLIAAVVALVGWLATRSVAPQTALGWLLVCVAALAASYHHWHCHSFAPDDISRFTKDTPQAVRVRGRLADEPDRHRPPRYDPLLTMQRETSSTAVLEVTVGRSRGVATGFG
jgi:competence protein ComEC